MYFTVDLESYSGRSAGQVDVPEDVKPAVFNVLEMQYVETVVVVLRGRSAQSARLTRACTEAVPDLYQVLVLRLLLF